MMYIKSDAEFSSLKNECWATLLSLNSNRSYRNKVSKMKYQEKNIENKIDITSVEQHQVV